MNPGTRRTLIITLIVVALLFLGRWTSELLTERWWAAAISPEAAIAVGRWQLLGVGLDALAILLASAWFILLALTIGRTVSAVHITRRLGNLDLREAIPTRYLFGGAILIGILLGWLTGAGASRWRAPVALAWLGVDWPVREPLLGADLGLFLVRLPLWEMGHEYLQTLLLVGLAFTGSLYLVIGALRRTPEGMEFHPFARRHLGWLLALVATSFAIGFLLDAWRLAATAGADQPLAGLRAHVALTKPAALLALLTGLASLRWGLGRPPRMATIGWSLTLVVLVGTTVVSPNRGVLPVDEQIVAGRLNDLAWGINRTDPAGGGSAPPLQVLWDERSLAAHEAGVGRFLLAVTPQGDTRDGDASPRWIVASTDSGLRRIQTRGIVEGLATAPGAPVELPMFTEEFDAVVRPGALRWREETSGVPLNHLVRRLILTWGRQALGIASLPDTARVDWHLDPVTRSAALLPMARWLPADIVLIDGRAWWISQGLIPVDNFPRAVRQPIQGESLAGLLPAFVSVIDPISGGVSIYLDPAASPLATAWQRFVPELIAPAESLSVGLRTALPYSAAWAVLQAAAVSGVGSSPPTTLWPGQGGVALQWSSGGGRGILAGRRDGLPTWTEEEGAPDLPAIRRQFGQLPLVLTVRDSVTARGDSVLTGPLRWGEAGALAWQSMHALVPGHGIRLLAISQSRDGAVTASRNPGTMRSSSDDGSVSSDLDPATARLHEARLWLARADSALRRGDLTAFGRYFEALQRALERDER